MKKATAAVGGTVLVLFIFALFGFVGFQNDANRFENSIKAQYTDNKNVYDNGWKMVQEKAQIPEMYTDDLKKLYDSAITGRYGESGSVALFQFIKEQNPTLDPNIYRDIQQAVETFRKRFQQAQTELVAKKQAYENFLTATVSGRFFNMISGYPHIDLNKYDIVTSEKTETDFSIKRSEPLRLRPERDR